MLTSKVFGSCTSDLCKAIADFIKHICINEIEFQNNTTSLETFIASRPVPLDKNPGLRPIGVCRRSASENNRKSCHEYGEG